MSQQCERQDGAPTSIDLAQLVERSALLLSTTVKAPLQLTGFLSSISYVSILSLDFHDQVCGVLYTLTR